MENAGQWMDGLDGLERSVRRNDYSVIFHLNSTLGDLVTPGNNDHVTHGSDKNGADNLNF